MAAVVPYALSVHAFINKVGAYAGFAAIVGVALVVIMLFVHARETASLRDRAEDAENRVDYLEQTVEHLSRVASQAMQAAQASQTRPGVTAAPAAAARATASAQRPVPAPAVAAAYAGAAASQRTTGPPPQLPAAPAGTGGPALSSATRLIPEPAAAGAHAAGSNGSGARANVAPAMAPTPAPSTAAAGAPIQIPAPRAADPRGDTAPPRSAVTDSGQAPRRNYGRSSEPRRPRRILPLVVVGVLVAAIAVAAVLVFGHHHTKAHTAASVTHTHSSTTGSSSKAGKKHKHTVTVNPRSVTVAVLNGTSTNNLAADVSQKLSRVGFKAGKTANFTNQSQTTTTVGFLPGHRPQALAVAKALKVKYTNVLKVNGTTEQLVCPAGAACPDQVFVVLGTDLNSEA